MKTNKRIRKAIADKNYCRASYYEIHHIVRESKHLLGVYNLLLLKNYRYLTVDFSDSIIYCH
jgi:hypothetical protein